SSFDGGNVYAVVLQVSDGNGGTATQNVQVTVTNANEAPSLAASAAVTLTENQSLATSIVATDVDGDTLSYAITGGADAALFTVGADGKLSFVTAPDFEAPGDANGDNVYDVIVTVSDGNGASASQSVAVTITDVNEAPVITSGDTIAMAEGRMAVLTMAGSDSDGDVLAWSIAGGLDASLFTIDSATGALSFITAPDYEAPADSDEDNIYQLSVKVSDGNGKSTTQSISIAITDTNEPLIITSSDNVTLAENRTNVMGVEATDGDGDQPTYAIAGGVDGNLFTINSTTGALSFKAAPDFDVPGDFDGDNIYDVIVSANDGTQTVKQAVTITLTNVNEAPVITSAAGATLADEQIAVMVLRAIDEDNDTLTWSITGGVDASLFTVDANTGALSFVTAPNYGSPSDSNSDNVYRVTVAVSDGNYTTSQDISVTITSDNSAPVITSNSSFTVQENRTNVATITAEDPENDTLTYSIVGGADADLFTVDSNGQLAFNDAPDFENPADSDGDNVYNVIIAASDGEASTQQSVSITVSDKNEAPTLSSSPTITLLEGRAQVGSVSASDSDGDPLTYAIAGGADGTLFTIDPESGALAFQDVPDFETPNDADGDNIYELLVSVSDGVETVLQSVTVTITDKNEAPVITSDADVTIVENRSEVMSIDALDGDGDNLTYTIAGGVDSNLFTIDELTGVLSFRSAPDFERPNDADENNVYRLKIAVSDGTSTTTQDILVTVADKNEAPVITSGLSLTVAENGTAVGTVAATDDDGDGLTFSLTGGADADLFTIDAATGALSFKVAPDYEAGQTSFVVEVSVSDGTIVTSDTVTITLTDVNEAPVITSALDVTVIEGDAGPVLFEAEDPDGDTLSWSIEPGGDGALFTIDGATGEISFKTAPDYANPADSDGDNVYALTITVDDGNGKSVTQDVTITVTDTNEAPEITSGGSVSLDENTTAVLS
ncbi:tandem-95 repeat protein, partial [Altererythrobacter indicus]